ncbi:class I SAM-dependent methyltransferase [Pseudohalocynthiibacter sp. F2068]|jgi:SAM-dependent methyltransferase|uniref:class I SAM-dependent methyltransferase n=1 Tax=Pseudohalocynthiibacter sp. F2068 TaxID=2926418 RepID=UPI001FF1A2E4|nr:class I SAM-dependent methyltransferase [Pseudohalocynthiibacter sp. F2068]MCK0103605.1 class I SAM-dependent methyltransferase [Pseudohalocynthiibacter sp. F2068]
MSKVQEQYEVFPYPERDPKDEKKRLVTGSPSHPLEIDHFVFGGKRDWSKPLRALVAGGGTGDALIQLAQVLSSVNRPYEITYIDLSSASRQIAEKRAGIRGLKNINFVTGSLLDVAEFGLFDYIDCCGVLHHLPEPQLGFDALAAALAPRGGLGFMVYAPYGRNGVYPLQEAFSQLLDGLSPENQLAQAKKIFRALPDGHPFKRNPHLDDHNQSDAGFFDLLLHSQDRPYTVRDITEALNHAGLGLVSFTQPALYDPSPLLPDGCLAPEDRTDAMEIAEKLRGTIKTHVGYATRIAQAPDALAKHSDPNQIPHMKGVNPQALAREVASNGQLRVVLGADKTILKIPKNAAPLLAQVDGRKSLGLIAKTVELDQFSFNAQWGPAAKALAGYGLLLYSRLLV